MLAQILNFKLNQLHNNGQKLGLLDAEEIGRHQMKIQ